MAQKRKTNILQKEITSATIGAVVGGVLGMLFSPKSGKQNRAALAKEGRKAVKVATNAVRSAEKKATKVVATKKVAKK